MHVEARRDGFLISTDPSRIDLDLVHAFLRDIYWCAGIPRDTVWKGIENSITFGVYEDDARAAATTQKRAMQFGFARVVTDRATFAYLTDVFILDNYRGRGLSAWLMEIILEHPDLQGLRRFCLLTRDAHGLYAKFGFKPLPDPSRYMELWDPEVYTRPPAP
jgi:GNAT superfamily N-acetyltransferase